MAKALTRKVLIEKTSPAKSKRKYTNWTKAKIYASVMGLVEGTDEYVKYIEEFDENK